MLHAERKKKKTGRRWAALCLMTILAAAGLAAGFVFTREKEALPVRNETGGTLVNRKPEEISRIRITARGKDAWIAERRADGFLYMITEGRADGTDEEQSEEWTLDPTLGERIEDALAHLVYEDILTDRKEDYADRLAEFGLAEPALTAEVLFSDGEKMTVRIGDESGLEDRAFRFMTIDGDPRLYAAAESLAEDLNVDRELLHPVVQPEIQAGRIDRVTIRSADGKTTSEWMLTGKITDTDAAENWQVCVPVVYPADQDQMRNLRKNAANLRLGIFIAQADDRSLAEYGLDRPQAEIEIHMAAGSTGQITAGGAYGVQDRKEESLRLFIGKSRNEMTDYCLWNDTIYTISHFSWTTIAEMDPKTTLARYPVTVEAENLKSLEIRRGDGSADLYELKRSTRPAETEGEPDKTETVCLKNGNQMDYSVFSAAYDRMRVVSFSGELPEGWIPKKPHTILIFTTLSGKSRRVELSEFDSMHDAVTVDGCTLFYLIRDGMGEMP